MIKDIKEINFPEYATLSQATVNIADMGERSITTQIKIDGSIVPDFSYDWEVEYKGERYIHAARTPQASKDNTSRRTRIDLTFKHWAISELQRYYFFETASTEAGTVMPDKYKASLGLSLPDFVNAFNKVLDYYFNGDIRIDLNTAWIPSEERSFVEISYSYLWDVLQKVYEIYGVRWTLEPVTGESRKYLIKFGYDVPEASHIFEYGYQGGLLKVERQVQSTAIKNVILGRGGNKNLPFLYFKDYDKYGAGTSEDASGSSETKTTGGVTASTIPSMDKNERRSVKATYSGTFEIAEGNSGVLMAGIPEATGQYKRNGTLYEILKYGKYKITEDVEVVFIALGSPTIRVFNRETNNEVSSVAIPAGKYYYTWENEVTNNYTDTIYNVSVTMPSLTLITGSGSSFNPSLIGNRGFRPDPDAIPELKDIAFTELRSSEFREYVQGWKAAHYGGEVPAEPSEAFIKGLTDKKFNPIEYVKDDDSIAKYGEQWGALESNEEIYPTIQNSGVDEVVAVEEMTNDYMTDEEAAEKDSEVEFLTGAEDVVDEFEADDVGTYTIENIVSFWVPAKKYAKLSKSDVCFTCHVKVGDSYKLVELTSENPHYEDDRMDITFSDGFVVHDGEGKKYDLHSIIGPKYYYIDWWYSISNSSLEDPLYDCESSISGFKLMIINSQEAKGPTFDIWTKNLWNTTRESNETPEQYAQRVWLPILGADGADAQVAFTTGLLSVSSDYQFTIAGMPELDESKSYNGNQSHWKISLYRSEAEYESTGKLIPNKQINAVAGDKFFFTGIELPHQYVVWAENRLHDYKKDSLITTSNILPTWVVSLDKVRCNNIEEGDVKKIIDQLAVGTKISLANEQLIGGIPLDLYIQSATYTWAEPNNDKTYIYPDVEIVLSDKVATVSNPVEEIKGDVSALQQQVGSLSNILQVIRTVGDRLYLRKDGIEDVSFSPTKFANLITGSKFSQGDVDGIDWGFYREDNGRAVLEVDRNIVRDKLTIGKFIKSLTAGKGACIDAYGNAEVESLRVRSYFECLELIVNRLSAIEGDQLLTESDTIESVDDLGNNCYGLHLRRKWDGYFTAQYPNNVLKGIINTMAVGSGVYYTSWMRVNSVNTASNYIEVTLYPDDQTPSGKNYSPRPMMNIARWGNQTDPTRQSCIYLSSTEGRIVRLTGVTKPIIDATNYGATFGSLPEFLRAMDLPIIEGQDYVYARGIITQDIIRIDYKGRPISEVVDRGPYDPNADYFSEDINPETGVYEISDVWYNGCKYRCAKTGTTTAPAWNNTDWAMVEGNPEFTVEFADTDYIFDPDRFAVTLRIIAKLHNMDITGDILDADVMWTRYSEDADGVERVTSDTAWAIKRAGAGKSIDLTVADCDFNGYIPRVLKFIATVTLRDGIGNEMGTETAVFEY